VCMKNDVEKAIKLLEPDFITFLLWKHIIPVGTDKSRLWNRQLKRS
jgi:hypothetical protein